MPGLAYQSAGADALVFGHGGPGCIEAEIVTVFKLKTPMTLSHSVPLFGCQPNSLDRPLAKLLTRSLTSNAEYSVPDRPHVNGALEYPRGCRP